MSLIRHARGIKPRLHPNKGGVPIDLDRIITRSAGVSQSSESVYEHGRRNKCGSDKSIPEAVYSVSQQEYGTNDLYKTLANLASEPVAGFTLADFENSLCDLTDIGKVDFGGALEQILWLPKLSVNSLELSIADPEGRIERNVELVGDDHRKLAHANNYFIYGTDTGATLGSYDIVVDDPAPVEDPNNTGVYILRLDRIRAGETTTIELTTNYTFDAVDTITVLSAEVGDEYRYYYTAGSWGTAGDPTTLNDVDPCFLKAENIVVEMNDGVTTVQLDILTSLTITASPSRLDESVLGSADKLIREVNSWEVSISLDGRVKEATIGEILMGVAGTNHGIVDVDEFLENASLTVKIYDDAKKTNFLIGYKSTELVFSDQTEDSTANEFATEAWSLTTDNLLITTDIGNL